MTQSLKHDFKCILKAFSKASVINHSEQGILLGESSTYVQISCCPSVKREKLSHSVLGNGLIEHPSAKRSVMLLTVLL